MFKLTTVLYLITQLLCPFPLPCFLLQNTTTKQNMTRTKKWIYICLSMNLVFVSRRFESFAGHSGSGGDGRRKSFEVVSSFFSFKITLHFHFFTLTHTHTHALTHMAAHRYTTTSQRFLCLLLPFHPWKQQGFSTKTIVVDGPSIPTAAP